MTKTAETTNDTAAKPEICRQDEFALLPLTVLVAILFLLLLCEQLGSRNLFEVIPLWAKYTWTVGAYICCFLACRHVGAGTREKSTTKNSDELERQVQRSINFFGMLFACGVTIVLAVGVSTMAPERIALAAPMFMFLPMLAGLICGDKFGYFRLRLTNATVVF